MVCFFTDACKHAFKRFFRPGKHRAGGQLFRLRRWKAAKLGGPHGEEQVWGPLALFREWQVDGGHSPRYRHPRDTYLPMGRSSVPSSFLSEHLSLCDLAPFNLSILFTKL